MQMQMVLTTDRIFANCVDQIALSGADGISFITALSTVMAMEETDQAVVSWLVSQLKARSPSLFTSPDFDASPDSLHITACEPLRNRALGYNVLEHGTLQDSAFRMLEVVGKAGPNGILQSDLASILKLSPVMVHHYLVSLLGRQLVAKKKVVLTRKKAKGKTKVDTFNPAPKGVHRGADNDDDEDGDKNQPASKKARKTSKQQRPSKHKKSTPRARVPPSNDMDEAERIARKDIEAYNRATKGLDEDEDELDENGNPKVENKPMGANGQYGVSVTVTYTAVIVLSRFEAFIANTNLTKTFTSIQSGDIVPAPGAPAFPQSFQWSGTDVNANEGMITDPNANTTPSVYSGGQSTPVAARNTNGNHTPGMTPGLSPFTPLSALSAASAPSDAGTPGQLVSTVPSDEIVPSLQETSATAGSHTLSKLVANDTGATIEQDVHHEYITDPDMGAPPPKNSSSVSIIDLTGDQRMYRIIEALQKTPVRAERDLKIICMPDDERPTSLSLDLFRRKRHRTYRTLRCRLARLGLVKVIKRDCKSVENRPLGRQPCLVLTKLGRHENAVELAFRRRNQQGGYFGQSNSHVSSQPNANGQGRPASDAGENAEESPNARYQVVEDEAGSSEGGRRAVARKNALSNENIISNGCGTVEPQTRAASLLPKDLIPLLHNFNGPALLAEIDIAQQVYTVMERAGETGISVPEMDAFFDCGTGLSGMPQKRLRNIIKAIARKESIMESQLFEGKIMFVRFALSRFVDSNNPDFRKSFPEIENARSENVNGKKIHKRRKTGITTLGERRQQIVLDLLNKRKVVVLETLGREVATIERQGLVRVDQKVMRRILGDLVTRKKIKIIVASKPSIKENKRWQSIRLVALPSIEENCAEVRRVVNAVVDRALYGASEDNPDADAVKKEESILEDDSDWELESGNRISHPSRPSTTPRRRDGFKSRPMGRPRRSSGASAKPGSSKDSGGGSSVFDVDLETPTSSSRYQTGRSYHPLVDTPGDTPTSSATNTPHSNVPYNSDEEMVDDIDINAPVIIENAFARPRKVDTVQKPAAAKTAAQKGEVTGEKPPRTPKRSQSSPTPRRGRSSITPTPTPAPGRSTQAPVVRKLNLAAIEGSDNEDNSDAEVINDDEFDDIALAGLPKLLSQRRGRKHRHSVTFSEPLPSPSPHNPPPVQSANDEIIPVYPDPIPPPPRGAVPSAPTPPESVPEASLPQPSVSFCAVSQPPASLPLASQSPASKLPASTPSVSRTSASRRPASRVPVRIAPAPPFLHYQAPASQPAASQLPTPQPAASQAPASQPATSQCTVSNPQLPVSKPLVSQSSVPQSPSNGADKNNTTVEEKKNEEEQTAEKQPPTAPPCEIVDLTTAKEAAKPSPSTLPLRTLSSIRPPPPVIVRRRPAAGSLKQALESIADEEVVEVPVQPNSAKVPVVPKTVKPPVCVQVNTRDTRKARIARLRAIDYGWMKGSMARARLFHKLLYKIASEMERANNENDDSEETYLDFNNTEDIVHVSIEKGRTIPTIGELKIYKCFNEMTVAEYAATVGMCYEHGDLLDSIREERVEDVVNIIKPEITSQHACRRIKALVQLLTKLGLIQPRGRSKWTLCGSGIIRDFGRGMPPGVVPHAVPFKNRKAVDLFWKELRQFSSFKMPMGRRLVQWRSEQPKAEREWNIRDIYHPVAWETGIFQDFSLYDQMLFEVVLQRLCGVDVSAERLNLYEVPLISKPLRSFTVEELVDELDRVGKSNEYVGKRQRYAAVAEGLLRYARLRQQTDMPDKLASQSEGFGVPNDGGQHIPQPKNVPYLQRSCILRVKRKGQDIESEEIIRSVPTAEELAENRRQGRQQARKKLRVEDAPIVRVDMSSLMSDLWWIIHFGSVSYCCEEVDFLDWRKVAASVHARKRQSNAIATVVASIVSSGPENTPVLSMRDTESSFRAITGLCHCIFLRSAFDIMSLRIVLQIRERAAEEQLKDNVMPRERVSEMAHGIMNKWKSLNDIIHAVVKEVSAEVEREWRIVIEGFDEIDKRLSVKPGRIKHRSRIMELFTQLDRRRANDPRTLSQTVHIMSSRFRRVASLRLRRNVIMGLLLQDDRVDDEFECSNPIRGHRPLRTSLSRRGRPPKFIRDVVNGLDAAASMEATAKRQVAAARRADPTVTEDGNTSGEANSTAEITAIPIDDESDQPCDVVQISISSNGMRLKRGVHSTLNGVNTGGLRTKVELAEVVVTVVLRQSRYEQWSVSSKKLMARFTEDSISLARDRQILRGSVALFEDYDQRRRHLGVCRPEKLHDPISFPSEENVVERENVWKTDARNKMRAEQDDKTPFELTNTEFYKDIFEPLPSISSSAIHAFTRMALLEIDDKVEIELSSQFKEEEGYDDEKCAIKMNWLGDLGVGKRRRTLASASASTEAPELKRTPIQDTKVNMDLTRWVSETVKSCKFAGIGLNDLLERMKTSDILSKHSRSDIAKSIRWALMHGTTRRFSIMIGKAVWTLWDGALYIDEEFCKSMILEEAENDDDITSETPTSTPSTAQPERATKTTATEAAPKEATATLVIVKEKTATMATATEATAKKVTSLKTPVTEAGIESATATAKSPAIIAAAVTTAEQNDSSLASDIAQQPEGAIEKTATAATATAITSMKTPITDAVTETRAAVLEPAAMEVLAAAAAGAKRNDSSLVPDIAQPEGAIEKTATEAIATKAISVKIPITDAVTERRTATVKPAVMEKVITAATAAKQKHSSSVPDAAQQTTYMNAITPGTRAGGTAVTTQLTSKGTLTKRRQIGAWSKVDGTIDINLVREVATVVLELTMRKPGIDFAVLINCLGERFPWLPRRCVADLLLSMIRVGFMNMEILERQQNNNCFGHLPSTWKCITEATNSIGSNTISKVWEYGEVDPLAVVLWQRPIKMCVTIETRFIRGGNRWLGTDEEVSMMMGNNLC